jgi:hypothetical protein
MRKINWEAHFQKHSKLEMSFGMPKTRRDAPRALPKASFGSDLGSDFENPYTQGYVPDPRIQMPPAINPPPDYDPFGGESSFMKFGRGRARERFHEAGASNFGIGVVIPSTYKPAANPPPPPPDAPVTDTGFGFSADAAPPQKSGILKTILAGIGLFVVGLFVDTAIERRLGPHPKPIVLFPRHREEK